CGGLGTSFLVNMDRLFESIVGRGVQRTLATEGVSVQLQATDRLDIDGHMTFRPDIVASRNGEPIAVADLKYKSDVSNSDVYQVLAYARRYGLASALLILPQRPRFRSLDVSGTSVHLHQFDLNTGSTDREAALRRVAGDLVGRRGAFANPCPTPTRSMNPWHGA